MLTYAGVVCLVLAAGLLGERRARQERRRLDILDSLLIGLTVLESEVAYLATGLAEALARAGAAAPASAELWTAVSRRIAEGESAGAAWRVTSQEWSAAVGLMARPAGIVCGLSAAFGPWRAEDMARHIRLAKDLLTKEQTQLRPHLEITCRMWRYVGVCSGLILALLLC